MQTTLNNPDVHRDSLRGFSVLELLTVIAIVSILAATSASVIPTLFQSGQVDSNVSTLSGIFEQAREAAISTNTYVYVLFSNTLPTTPVGGVAAVILESEDGTDCLATSTGVLTATGSINSIADLLVLHKLQPLPGIKLTTSGTITSSTNPGISSLPAVSPVGASLAGNPTALSLIMNSGGTSYTFTQGVEFKPDGEAIASTSWNDLIEFGIEPIHQTSNDVAVLRLTRLTGRLTVYRQ